jgi:hypothetical protein
MSSSKKKRDAAKRRLKREPRAREHPPMPGVPTNAKLVKLDIHREIRYITQRAQAEDARIVTVGNLVLFSTETRDAWLLDTEDNFAACLCREGELQPLKITDTPDVFAIDWPACFAIEGTAFVVQEQSGRTVVIQGYPTANRLA